MWDSGRPWKGHVILGGYTFQITELALRGGKICIKAERAGPAPFLDGPVTIFGEDGWGFGQSDTANLTLRPVGPSEVGVLNLDISIDTLEPGERAC